MKIILKISFAKRAQKKLWNFRDVLQEAEKKMKFNFFSGA